MRSDSRMVSVNRGPVWAFTPEINDRVVLQLSTKVSIPL